MGLYDHSQYVSMTMEFRCNLKCVHCMIEDTMDRLAPESLDSFNELLEHNKATRQWSGLILTGSEITLRNDLVDLVVRARKSGFDHVRIQTHGMHLAQESFCDRLVDAGVDEFFVSVAGSDAASHDDITQLQGSFDRTLRGLENLEQYDHVHAITNTVVTSNSYILLPDVVERLRHLKRLMQMEFWVYWPMSETDEKDLLPSHMDIHPYLTEAIKKCRSLGRQVEVKNYPVCLLAEEGGAVVNSQPHLYIDPDFWNEFMRNGFYQCKHYEACSSHECLGLSTSYIKKYGWEQENLNPVTKDSLNLIKTIT